MDIELLEKKGTIALLLAIGDDPGRTPRSMATFTNSKGEKSVDQTVLRRIGDLVRAGLADSVPDVYRGREVTRISLSATGRRVYALLVALREM